MSGVFFSPPTQPTWARSLCPIISVPSEPMNMWFPLCWWPGCPVPWSPWSASHFLLRVERVLRTVWLLWPCPPWVGCLLPWVSSTDCWSPAGPQKPSLFMLGGEGTASGFSHYLMIATKALQFSTMFVSHTRAAKTVMVDLSPDRGKYSHTTNSNCDYSCLRIYYALIPWHIFLFNLRNNGTKLVLLPSAFYSWGSCSSPRNNYLAKRE